MTAKSGKRKARKTEHVDSTRELTRRECVKLLKVFEMLDKAHIIDIEASNGITLRSCLSSDTPPSIQQVRTVVQLASIKSHSIEKLDNKLMQHFEKTVTDILDGLEGIVTKAEVHDDMYALHRNMGTLDVFSAAARLSSDDLELLKTVRDTDVFHVASSKIPSGKPSKLEDLFTKQTNKQPTRPRQGASLLYYDAYSSFAPSYDSHHSGLSYTETIQLEKDRSSLLDHVNSLKSITAAQTIQEDPIPIDPAILTEEIASTQEERHEMSSFITKQDLLSTQLQNNASLLRKLQAAQFDRVHQFGATEKGAQPTEEENAAANALLKSLTQLASLRPQSAVKVMPCAQDLSTLQESIMSKPIIQIKGNIDPQNPRALKDSALTAHSRKLREPKVEV